MAKRQDNDIDSLEAGLGPGGIAFVEAERFGPAFCELCSAEGDEDRCPCGLDLGRPGCYKAWEWRQLVQALVAAEYDATYSDGSNGSAP